MYYISAVGNSIRSQLGSSCQGIRYSTGGQAVRPVYHVQNHTCWVTLLQPARQAAVLGQPSSLRPHWYSLSPSRVTENPCSLLGGGEIFFLREEQPRVDETIISAPGDTKLKPKKVLVLFRSELFTSFRGKTILIMQILRKAGATIFLLFLYASFSIFPHKSRTKITPAGSPSSSQPERPPCWDSPLAFGLIGTHSLPQG